MTTAYHEYDPASAPQLDPREYRASMPIVYGGDSDKYYDPVAPDNVYNIENIPEPKRHLWRKPWFWAFCAVGITILTIAATVGGVLGSRKTAPRASTPSDSVPPSPTPTTFNPPPRDDIEPTTINDGWAYNGTNIASLTFTTTGGPTGTNYVVFYQHSNGEIRRTTWNNSQWHESVLVTADARPGTALAAYWKGNNFDLNLFYFDKNNVAQELRGRHNSNTWLNGTLGQLSLVAQNPSHLSVVYVGGCQGAETAWLVYQTTLADVARVVYWNGDRDTWALGDALSDVKSGAGFFGHADVGMWRFYYHSSGTGQLKELICPDCCDSGIPGWKADLNGPVIGSPYGGIAVTNVGLPRMVYYVDEDSTIRELNNTFQYPNEVWMRDISSTPDRGNTGLMANPNATVGPEGSTVAVTIPNGKMTISAGFRGRIQQMWLFYQTNATDISVQTRDADSAGEWSDPSPIPVAR